MDIRVWWEIEFISNISKYETRHTYRYYKHYKVAQVYKRG